MIINKILGVQNHVPRILALGGALFLSGCGLGGAQDADTILSNEINLDLSYWEIGGDGFNHLEIRGLEENDKPGILMDYQLVSEANKGWVMIWTELDEPVSRDLPIVFDLKADSNSEMEVKFIDSDGSVFRKVFDLGEKYQSWNTMVIYADSMDYAWDGEDDLLQDISRIEVVIAGQLSSGTASLLEPKLVEPGLPATFREAGPQLDPNRELEGIGFKQRRDISMIPKDPGVLEYMKQVQDTFTPEKALLASQEGVSNQLHTFNNALAAMAFIVEDEQERAERILDFFANATDVDNSDPHLQQFYLNGEARGFYQDVKIVEQDGVGPYKTTTSDRWMGDLTWLLMAYKHYEKAYGGERYEAMTNKLIDLLIEWYVDDEATQGGYLAHGWRRGDSYLHEGFGHHEGNIDAFAVMNLVDKPEYAKNIRIWLDSELRGNNLPLDLYTWRVLAYGSEASELLNIPEYDLRFRKTVEHNGEKISGFYHGADIDVSNIWLDGTGHIAVAFLHYGDKQRGYFYTNQLGHLLIDREINGVDTRALPYTANKTGGYDWVDPNRGFTSVVAWYLFAQNGFNPMTLEQVSIDR
ncbi:hypothetical protein [Vibrio methylphosphonaticus]|uniref:hypothetical protein n=1 Tax=Vibrio methylphosphonaticus TaxID=2946866 RepID=UPI00202A6557|nr:hypothetical protein [Vibrio methylphosphonaticus]MCL9774058.1 hypothetical protein [Vibrio methylphosphonaticus]